jgi:hypothetical protein
MQRRLSSLFQHSLRPLTQPRCSAVSTQRVLIDRSFRSCVVNLGEFAVQLGELVVGADHFLDTAIFDLPTIE